MEATSPGPCTAWLPFPLPRPCIQERPPLASESRPQARQWDRVGLAFQRQEPGLPIPGVVDTSPAPWSKVYISSVILSCSNSSLFLRIPLPAGVGGAPVGAELGARSVQRAARGAPGGEGRVSGSQCASRQAFRSSRCGCSQGQVYKLITRPTWLSVCPIYSLRSTHSV